MIGLLRRAGTAIVVVLLASVAVFAVLQILPGDPARRRLPLTATDAQVAAERIRLGLDNPPVSRYLHWLAAAVRGDLGTSWASGRPVRDMIAESATSSLWLVLAVIVLTVPTALALALAAGLNPGGRVDRLVLGCATIGLAMPSFVVAIGAILLFSTTLGVLPAVSSPELGTPEILQPRVLAIPVLVLAIGVVAYVVPYLRAQLVVVDGSPAVEAARLRGVAGWRLVHRYLLPGIAPVAGRLLALGIIALATESIVVEAVCGYPGLGTLIQTSVASRDLPAVQGVAALVSVVVVLALSISDGAIRPPGNGPEQW